MKYIALIFAGFLLFVASPGYTNSPAEIGDQIPHDLVAIDQNGERQNVETLMGEQGLVIFFVRSLDWCPYCQNQIMGVNDNQSAFNDAGYHVISISHDTPDVLKRFADQHDIGLTLLADPQSEIIKAFGILNTNHQPGDRFYGIPNPTIYVVNQNRQITAILAEDGYKDRPKIGDVLTALE